MSEPDASAVATEVRAAFAEEAIELLRMIEVAINELSVSGGEERVSLLRDTMRMLHTLKGAAAVVGAEELKRDVHVLEEYVRRIEREAQLCEPSALEEIHDALARVHGLVLALLSPDEEAKEERVPLQRVASGDFLRIRPEKIDAVHVLSAELAVARLAEEAITKRLIEASEQAEDARRSSRQLSLKLGELRDAELVGKSGRLSAELAELSQRLTSLARELSMVKSHAATVSVDLEDKIRELRMMPIEPFFEEFAKVVRESARELQKKARLSIMGDSAEIDRAVLVELRDPILHLVRNALTHGIESPLAREALGKDATGTVRLSARSEGARVILEVSDDGGGIDVDRVRKKAIEQGLLAEGEPLDEAKLLDLLGHPGFSTRDDADTLAGRGVGLDVVANAVRELEGRFSLSTKTGKGTTFAIDVPVSVSTGLGLRIEVRQFVVGILLKHIERVIRVCVDDIVSLPAGDAVSVGKSLVSVVSLAGLFGLEPTLLGRERRPALVLRQGRERLVVVVDDIPGEQTMVIKSLNRAFAGASFLLGATMQADGSVLPVLRVAALFERARGRSLGTRLLREEMPSRRAGDTTILVVDDSLTIRMLLRNILVAVGYTVTTAADGRAALEELERMKECHLVVADLQMPQMDGFELCQALRRSRRAHVPIVIVTSVGDTSEKERALEAGADAYVVKSTFKQDHFLDIVSRLLGAGGNPS